MNTYWRIPFTKRWRFGIFTSWAWSVNTRAIPGYHLIDLGFLSLMQEPVWEDSDPSYDPF